MEKVFEVVTNYTPESYKTMLDFNFHLRFLKVKIFFYVFCGISVAFGIYLLFSKDIAFAISYLLFGVFFFFYPWLLKKRVITRALKNVRKTDSMAFLYPVTTVFYEDYFQIFTPQSNLIVYYPQVYESYEKPDNFYIYLSKQKIAPLPKSAFTVGTPQAFALFLQYKLGERFKGIYQ